MSSGESILLLFNFFVDCFKDIYDILDGFEFLPGISYLDFLIAIAIIGLCLKLIRFGVSKSETYVDNELVRRGIVYKTGWGPFSKTKTNYKSLKKKKGSN